MAGYVRRETQVFVALTEPMLVMGVERKLALGNMFTGFISVMSFHVVYLLPLNYVCHQFLKHLNKTDTDLLLVYKRFKRQADHYDPWHQVYGHTHRPVGFGDTFPC